MKSRRYLAQKTKSLVRQMAADDVPVVLASTGRAGSTVLYKALLEGYINERWGVTPRSWAGKVARRLSGAFIDRLDDTSFNWPSVAKTHDLFPETVVPSARFVFVHGDPLHSAMSVQSVVDRKGLSWFREHQYHLRAEGKYEDLYWKDVLNYENQIRSWMSKPRSGVLCIAYENLWERVSDIERFVGFPVQLPPQRERTSHAVPKDANRTLFSELRELRHNLSDEEMAFSDD